MPDLANAENSYLETTSHFRLWRSFDLVSAFFSLAGIVFSTIDYELNYSSRRNYSNCEANPIGGHSLRYFTAISTFAAIATLMYRYYEKLRWKIKVFCLPRDHIYISSKKKNIILMCVEISVLCLFPYPNYEKNIYIPLRIHFQTIHTCYTLSEVLYVLMFLRFFIILRALINYSSFQNERGRAYCQANKVKPNLRFLAKCLVAQDPIFFISGLAVLSLFILALTFRVFERPTDDISNFFYSNPMTAIWFMVENMTTLGYGDYYPITYPARIISVAGYCVGAIIFALMILSMQEHVQLTRNQGLVYNSIIKMPQSALIITSCVKYYLAKKRLGSDSSEVIMLYLDLQNNISKYRMLKAKTEVKPKKELLEIRNNIKKLHLQVRKINKTVSEAVDCLLVPDSLVIN